MELLERDPEIQELGIRMIWLWLEISKPLISRGVDEMQSEIGIRVSTELRIMEREDLRIFA